MVCVRPGVLLVRASARRPARALMALDFPTFERPASATTAGTGGASSLMRPVARRNTPCEKLIIRRRGILIKSRLSIRGSQGMKRAVALAAAMLVASLASGQDKPPVIAGQVCAACHAADGNSVASANPKIAGQFVEYLGKQLRDFKAQAGKTPARQSAVMNGMVANLSDADMKNLAAYYAGQSLKPSAAADKELAATGQKLWRGGDSVHRS